MPSLQSMAVREPAIFERTHSGQYRGLPREDLLLMLLQLAFLYLPQWLAPEVTARALHGVLPAFLENAQLCVLSVLVLRVPLNIAARYFLNPRLEARRDSVFARLLTREMLVPLLTLPLPMAALFAVLSRGEALHAVMSVALLASTALLIVLYVVGQSRLWVHNGITAALLRGPGRQLLPRVLWSVIVYGFTALLLLVGHALR